jgi:glutamate racemase
MSKPIGVFDSGVGGLTVLRELDTGVSCTEVDLCWLML